MTIIVLGESIPAATVAVRTAVDSGELTGIGTTVVGGAVLVYAMWWLAVGAGVVVVVEVAAGHGRIGRTAAG